MILQEGKIYYITIRYNNQKILKYKVPFIILRILSPQEYETYLFHPSNQIIEMSYLNSNTSFVQVFSMSYINAYFEEIK